MMSKPCFCFLAYNFGKNSCENDILKIRFVVCKFGKSHNNKSFIAQTTGTCTLFGPYWENIRLVLFLQVCGPS